MIFTMNHTSFDDEFDRFGSNEALKEYLEKNELDGIEYMSFGEVCPRYDLDIIKGIHLHIPNSWMDIWNSNTKGIIEEYGSLDNAKSYVGGITKEFLINDLTKQLIFAKKAKALYVVFHVTDIKMKESVTWDFSYSDELVVDCAIQWINSALRRVDMDCDFLMENLWWPGFKMTDKSITKRLLDGVRYEKKGIMLDTGHLLHTNLEINTEEEGLIYINKCLDENSELCKYIKGIHLNQSLTGDKMKQIHNSKIDWKTKEYDEISNLIWEYVFEIDTHKPFRGEGVKKLIQRIMPKYVTLEFISKNREEHEEMLEEQRRWL